MRSLILLSLPFFIMAGTAGTAHPATIMVPDEAATIAEGLQLAAFGDTVQVACGTYLEHNIPMKSGVVLRGQNGQPECVIIDCQDTGSGIICSSVDSTSVIEALTITAAFDSAMKLTSAYPRISDVHFVDNESYFGGGIDCIQSNPIIEGCLFQGNMGYGDGAISMYGSSPAIRDCDFIGNRGFVDGPGAVWCRQSAPTFERCRFLDNLSDTFAGALYAFDESNLTIIDCTFAGNSAPGYPGAISYPTWDATEQTIIGSTFFGNDGSAIIRVGDADLFISNTIIAGNLAPALAVDDSIPEISCTNIHGNEGGDWTAPIAHLLGLDGNIDQDPSFCDAPDGDLTLASGSPCAPAQAGACGLMGAWPVGCDSPSAVDPSGSRPPGLALSPCRPNPFNPATIIAYHLPAAGSVSVGIYDVAGRLVTMIIDGQHQDPGSYQVAWRGRDDHDRDVSSGNYLCRLVVGGTVRTRSMTLLR